jgi:hypothetical protein
LSRASNQTGSRLPNLGGLTVPAVAQDHPGAFQLGLDAEAFDVALKADRVAVQLMLNLREAVPHLMCVRPMSIRTENRAQPSQVRRELLDRDALLSTQLSYGLPM